MIFVICDTLLSEFASRGKKSDVECIKKVCVIQFKLYVYTVEPCYDKLWFKEAHDVTR